MTDFNKSDFQKSNFNKSSEDSIANLKDVLKHKKILNDVEMARLAEEKRIEEEARIAREKKVARLVEEARIAAEQKEAMRIERERLAFEREQTRKEKLELFRQNQIKQRIKPFTNALMSDITREISRLDISDLSDAGTMVISSNAFKRDYDSNEFYVLFPFRNDFCGLVSSRDLIDSDDTMVLNPDLRHDIALENLNFQSFGLSRTNIYHSASCELHFFQKNDGTVFFGSVGTNTASSVYRIDLEQMCIEEIHDFGSPLTSFDGNEIGIIATTQGHGNSVYLFSTGKITKLPHTGKKSTGSIISPCGSCIAILCSADRLIKLYKGLLQNVKSYEMHSHSFDDRPLSMAFSEDSRYLFVTTKNGDLEIINTETCSRVDTIPDVGTYDGDSGLSWGQTDLSNTYQDMIPPIDGYGRFWNLKETTSRCGRYVFSNAGILDKFISKMHNMPDEHLFFRYVPVPLYPKEIYISTDSQDFIDSLKQVAEDMSKMGFEITSFGASFFQLEWAKSVL
jgi:WD40 repeat protein